MSMFRVTAISAAAVASLLIASNTFAQTPAAAASTSATSTASATVASVGVALPDDYVIGPEDVLGILFWREPDMSGEVTVRPDGKISLPLIGEVKAAGLKPDVLREQLQSAGGRYLADANANVVVKQINSRKVFVTGQVSKPGAYPLTSPHSVMQAIALAGGLTEYAEGDKITIMRSEQGHTQVLKFNYKKVSKGVSLEQNIQLMPGDTVVVP